jgi:hypothetical protein
VTHLPEECGNLDRGERGIGLAAFPLLGVVPQEIGVTDLDLQHRERASNVAAEFSIDGGGTGPVVDAAGR